MAKRKEKYCSRCGRILIFSYYKKSGSSYKLCKKCYREKKREEFRQEVNFKIEKKRLKQERKRQIIEERLERTGMRQSYLSMIVKILIGIMFVSFATRGFLDKDYEYMKTSLIISVVFLAWGILPYILRKKN